MKQLAIMAAWKVQENPSIAAGICVFAVAFALVAANAMVGQSGGHPGPIWATRDYVTTRSLPAEKLRKSDIAPADIAALSLDRIPVPTMRPDTGAGAPVSVLVHDAQAGLAQLGLYSGAVDGIFGPRTQEAVIAFQRRHDIAEDGQIGTTLTAAIDHAVANSVVGGAEKAGADTARLRVEIVEARPDPAIVSKADLQRTAMVARIQIGLNNFGETGITVNGTVDPQTLVAIRNFQARYDLPVSGQPDQQLMDKLEEIGALRRR